jgi:Anti-sigma-K factor rskA/Putative zinc-finger
MRHEEYKDLLALEAAGAVDPSELRALDAHLATCAECRAELDELRGAAASLAYTVAPAAPPAGLRASLLAQVRELKARPATAEARDASPARADGARPATDLKEEARRLVRRLGLWDIFRARPALGFGAAAAVLLLAALAALSLTLWGRARELRAEVARLSERLGETEGEQALARGQLARMREVNELLTAPGARLMSLAGTKTAPRAHARVAYDQTSGRVLLLAYELPPAPAGKAYQLWFIAGGKPLPGGVFKPDARGQGSLSDRLPTAPGLNAFAVTLEDERGVQTAQGAMYLLGADS